MGSRNTADPRSRQQQLQLRNANGYTPLMVAAAAGHAAVVDAMLLAGADMHSSVLQVSTPTNKMFWLSKQVLRQLYQLLWCVQITRLVQQWFTMVLESATAAMHAAAVDAMLLAAADMHSGVLQVLPAAAARGCCCQYTGDASAAAESVCCQSRLGSCNLH
jgi:hypothetical protein